MAYRSADPPPRSKEEEELSMLAAAGRQVRRGQAEQAQAAALAQKLDEQKALRAREESRLRALGRRKKPLQATLVIGATITAITAAGGYAFSQSGMHPALWINLLVWVVFLPSIVPAIFLERRLALGRGRQVEAEQKAWSEAQDFQILGLPWDQYDRSTAVRIHVLFQGGKPEPQLLSDALRAVSSEIVVDVVGLLGDEPDSGDDEAMEIESLWDDEKESLTDMRAQVMLAAHGGGFTLAASHRGNHYAEHWLESWVMQSVAVAFQTVHRAFPIESLELRDS